MLKIPNSESNGSYLAACKQIGAKQHPARFPAKLPEFFIRMLTEPGDTVLDIFAGSNTTGQVAEAEKRNWLSFEISKEYVASSALRFITKEFSQDEIETVFNRIMKEEVTHFECEPSQEKKKTVSLQ